MKGWVGALTTIISDEMLGWGLNSHYYIVLQ